MVIKLVFWYTITAECRIGVIGGIDLVWECGYIVFDGTPQTNHERHVIHRIHLLRASGVRFALFHKTISKWLSKSITTRGYWNCMEITAIWKSHNWLCRSLVLPDSNYVRHQVEIYCLLSAGTGRFRVTMG